jgi:hypothetical protein
VSRFAQWVREHIGGASTEGDTSAGEPGHTPAGGRDRAWASQGDALTSRAGRLVDAATTRATESYAHLAGLHPSLAAVARDRWEVCATAAAACMGLQMMVRRPDILESFEPLQGLVHGALAARRPEAPALFDQCRLFLARAATTHSTFTGQNVVGDRIGLWLLTTLFTHPPTVHEQGLARTLGRAMDLPLQAWWD